MQVQKEEIRNSIINSAKEEFYTKGYPNASLRKIVKNAGTTIGNFYNYFENKEKLFLIIVTPVYEKFVSFLKGHKEADDLNEIQTLNIDVIRQIISYQLKDVTENFEKTLVILIDGSKGTKYENVKVEMIGFLAEHFMAHLEKASQSFRTSYYQKLAETTAISFIEGLLDILRKKITHKEREQLILDYILFFTYGAFSLIKKLDTQ